MEADGPKLELGPDEEQQLLSAFPPEAFLPAAVNPPVASGTWSSKLRHYASSDHVDPDCAVRGENHLERSILDVFQALQLPPIGAVLSIGGLYGGKHGEGAEAPDDPAVELLLELQQTFRGSPASLRAMCWGCKEGEVANLTRAQPLVPIVPIFEVRPFPEVADLTLAPALDVPAGFQGELDLLRFDALPLGRSCQALAALLRAGVRPRLLAMFVLSQIPPPYKFIPLASDVATHPAALMACSLSAVADIVAPFGLSLLRLTGPYALFVARHAWRGRLPLNELECYRRAAVWGLTDIPLHFVRDWLFSSVDEGLPQLWGNLSALYASAGQAGAPFTLAV
ncbi:unnamed protein product [Polarella glacialis]|uniref:Uncharacterized protein n=1 Tax=Polarella glacialis TaxID=89957 RepID=A0A813LE20_POLGL|nr:unnamed protein product [Polarella glacialis]